MQADLPVMPLFEVHAPGVAPMKIWADGRLEGFPAGSVVVNRALPAVQYALGLLVQARSVGAVSEEQAATLLRIWEGAC